MNISEQALARLEVAEMNPLARALGQYRRFVNSKKAESGGPMVRDLVRKIKSVLDKHEKDPKKYDVDKTAMSLLRIIPKGGHNPAADSIHKLRINLQRAMHVRK